MNLTNSHSEKHQLGRKFKLDLNISEEIVDAFAKLTGDSSSLHTNDDYARRSMFKQRVMHGMIPIAFIAGLNEMLDTKNRISFYKFSARFLKPIFINTELALEVWIAGLDSENHRIECEFKVTKKKSGSLFTTGLFGIELHPGIDSVDSFVRPDSKEDHNITMISADLRESGFSFDEINKGSNAEFHFKIDTKCKLVLYDILKTGASGFAIKPGEWIDRCEPNNLLAILMLSTFVGMCIPGKYATFIDFNIGFEKDVLDDRDYLLSGKVAFKSRSTSSIVEMLTIKEETPNGASVASAKISAKVDTVNIDIPSIEYIAKNDLDLGLKGKIALITGGSGGIGRTIAKLLALHGVNVAINYYSSKEDAERTVDEIHGYGGEAIALRADIREHEQVIEMVDAIKEKFDSPNILVNCAVAEFYPKAFLDSDWEDFERELSVTIRGAFNCCQKLLPLMIENGGGKIINLSTVAAEYPPMNQSKYVTAKSALVGLTRSLAVEFAQFNIQVNLVVPSLVKTNLTKHISDFFVEDIRRNTPMKRIATPSDVAKTVTYLASSLSPFTTGQKIMVTGGSAPFI